MSLHHGVTSVWHLQKRLDKRNNNKRCHGVMEIHGDDTNPKPIRYMHLHVTWIYIQRLSRISNGRNGQLWGVPFRTQKKMIFLIKPSFWKWPVLISCQNLKILDSSKGEPMKATECHRDLGKLHPGEMVTTFCKPVKCLNPFCTTKSIPTSHLHPFAHTLQVQKN